VRCDKAEKARAALEGPDFHITFRLAVRMGLLWRRRHQGRRLAVWRWALLLTISDRGLYRRDESWKAGRDQTRQGVSEAKPGLSSSAIYFIADLDRRAIWIAGR